MDIAHDRAGFYLCWGCLNWVPGVYTSQVLYMTRHPRSFSQPAGIALLLVGTAMIYINWEADAQRQKFRETNGRCTIWSQPPRYIRAKYTTGVMSSVGVGLGAGPAAARVLCTEIARSLACLSHLAMAFVASHCHEQSCSSRTGAVTRFFCMQRCQRSHSSVGDIL
jgi:Ergosterol biosynthesis ERG4/ERG24 family